MPFLALAAKKLASGEPVTIRSKKCWIDASKSKCWGLLREFRGVWDEMKSAVHVDANSVADIIFQPASLDIWEAKYRLRAKDGTRIDETIDDTFKRVARALAEVEEEPLRDKCFDEFLWALRSGAIPAGRIISNAGAQEHKPATSTINCTV